MIRDEVESTKIEILYALIKPNLSIKAPEVPPNKPAKPIITQNQSPMYVGTLSKVNIKSLENVQ